MADPQSDFLSGLGSLAQGWLGAGMAPAYINPPPTPPNNKLVLTPQGFTFAGMPAPAATKTNTTTSPVEHYAQVAAALLPGIVRVESGGAGAPNTHNTGYTAVSGAGAMGKYQVMPKTAETLAGRLGMSYRPDLMTSATPEGMAYQEKIGPAAIFDAVSQAKGDPVTALRLYNASAKAPHSTTDPYVESVLGLRPGTMAVGVQNNGGLLPDFLPATDPNAIAANYGPAAQVTAPTLPDAPTLQAGPAHSHLQGFDKDALLAQIAANAPVGFDQTAQGSNLEAKARDSILGALSAAAGSSNGSEGFGAFLAKLGAAGEGAFQKRQDAVDSASDARAELVRQFAAGLAQQGLGIDEHNVGVANQNTEADYQTGKDAVDTANTNALNKYKTQLQQAADNFEAARVNAGSTNSVNLARASAVSSAMEGNTSAERSADSTQAQLVQAQKQAEDKAGHADYLGRAFGAAPDVAQNAAGLLASAGVPVPGSREKVAPDVDNAQNASLQIADGNVSGALNSLGIELVRKGVAADILGKNPTDTPKQAAAKKQLLSNITQLTSGKNANAATVDAAGSALGAFFNSSNQARSGALAVAQKYADLGYPVAQMIRSRAVVTPPKALPAGQPGT